jgi:6,7-dimethyl-8-ribityllumazine synthase
LSSRRAFSRPGSRLAPLAPREIEGEPDASRLKVTVVCSRWNPTITDGLLESALASLASRGARSENVTVVRVPGAFELPAAAALALAARAPSCDAVVVLGAIVRGETTHHEVLAQSVGTALAQLSARDGRPIGFGLLTCDTMDQARARTGKGAEAAEAAVEMANLRRRLAARKQGKAAKAAPSPRPSPGGRGGRG